MERRQRGTGGEKSLVPVIDAARCTGCKTCIRFCRNRVLTFDKISRMAKVTNPDHCLVTCRICAGVCPEGAVSFQDEEAFIRYLKKRLAPLRSEPPIQQRANEG